MLFKFRVILLLSYRPLTIWLMWVELSRVFCGLNLPICVRSTFATIFLDNQGARNMAFRQFYGNSESFYANT
uniref:Uncharacterized protein n=1 Tax=Rhizophora mucronata TaxID=61149 RepID=A0A2P2IZR6_RHIMU